MHRHRVLGTLLGFLAAVLLLSLLFYVVGIEDFVAEIGRANGWLVALVVVATLGWLTAWGLGLRTVLDVLGAETTRGESFLIVNGAQFSNNVTPFGQAGGEPITALLISKLTGTEYERALAAIASLDTLNFVPSMSLALLGAGYYATQVTFNRRLRIATVTVVLLAIAIPGLGYLIWRYRQRVKRLAVRVVTPVLRLFGAIVPVETSFSRRTVAHRVERFSTAIGRVGTSRRGLALALAASTAGWGFQMLGLWLAFRAIGASIPFSILLFVVPVGAIASITPLPGGVGGIEAVLVGLLSSLPGGLVEVETALAAVVIFRGAVYWVPVAIGGVVMSVHGIDTI